MARPNSRGVVVSGGAGPAPSSGPTDRYEKLEKKAKEEDILGEGTYGTVYKAKDKHTNRTVALKKVRVDEGDLDAYREGIPATALREISVLKEVRHPNVVELLDVFVSFHGHLYLVFELLDRDLKAQLEEYRRNRRVFSPQLVKWYMWQLLSGLEACHAHRIVHRDIKPHNILLSDDHVVKLADFGLARTYSVPLRAYTHEVVTLWYRCPEVLLGQEVYSTAVDMWSVGCIFAEMSSGKPLFDGDSEIDQLYKIFMSLGTPTTEEWPDFPTLPDYKENFPRWHRKAWSAIAERMDDNGRDLLRRLLEYDPARRITCADALAHPYFRDVAPPPGARPAAASSAHAAAAAPSAGAGRL